MKTLIALIVTTLLAVPAVAAGEPERNEDALRRELAEARREMADAARRVAELGRELGAEAGGDYRFEMFAPGMAPEGPRRAMLGIGIGRHDDKAGGVEVMSVTPGGPADQAGLRAGDVIARIGKTDLAKSDAAPRALLAALRDVEPGTEVEVQYLRGKDERSTRIKTEAFDMPFRALAGRWRDRDGIAELPGLLRPPVFLELMQGWGDLELAPMSRQLGEYFGTDQGLLVVHAPQEQGFKLQDGDVILTVGGRKPEDPAHAMRILRSYRGGEKLSLEIMRKRKKQALEIEVPERRSSELLFEPMEREIVLSAPAPN